MTSKTGHESKSDSLGCDKGERYPYDNVKLASDKYSTVEEEDRRFDSWGPDQVQDIIGIIKLKFVDEEVRLITQ